MKKLTIFGVLFLFGLLTPFFKADAKNYPHEAAKVEISIPDSWEVGIDGDVLTAATPDDAINLVFSIIELNDIEAALDEVEKQLKSEFQEVTIGEPEEIEINGMPALDWEGTATLDGVTITIGGSLIITPAEKTLFIFAAAAPELMAKYGEDIETIANGIKPMK